ncbi:MAG TPA: TolC family protein [Labilithrix sp.]|nr:TolC family protein [Labilithrix sp.]
MRRKAARRPEEHSRTSGSFVEALAVVAVLAGALLVSRRSSAEPASAAEPTKPSAGTITFDEAVKRALARNPTAEVAAQEVMRAEALRKQARATWLPTLNANGIYTRLDDDRELNDRVILAQNQLSANVQLTVPLVAPRQWVAYARSKENVEVARAGSIDARREVALATARAYLTVIAQHRVLDTAQRALATAKAHEDYATTRLQGGVGNRLDAVRAGQERATAEVRVKTQLTALARAQEALGVVTGEEGALDAASDPALAAPLSFDAALTESASRRADIAVQRDRVEVARRAVRDSWVDYLPVLSAVAQPFYQNPPTFTQPRTGWQAQLLLQIPLFDGGARYGVADEREALEAQARVRLEGALRQARSEVRVAFEAMRRTDEALGGAREAARLAREALDLAELAYKAGATSNIEVVDAERRANEAETAAAVAEDASRQARLDLLAACGRFP